MKALTLLMLATCGLTAVSANVAAQDNVSTCQAIANDVARLACYDTLFAGEDVSKINIPKAVAAAPAATNTPQVSKEDAFGAESLSKQEEDTSLTLSIAKISKNAFGIRTLTMSNAQIWKETESSSLSVSKGQRVTIEKGLFLAYYLSVEGSNRKMRVKRVK